MPRFTTASATRSSRARSSAVNASASDLVENAWESSSRTLSHFPIDDVLEKKAITVWKGSQNLLSSGIILYGGGREESMKGQESPRHPSCAGSKQDLRARSMREVKASRSHSRPLELGAYLFQDFPFRLKPVIKGALADAVFIDRPSSRRDPRVETFRYGGCGRIGLRAAK